MIAVSDPVAALNHRLLFLARVDPTRTGALRRRFLSEMFRRWNALERAVVTFVGEEDGLHLVQRGEVILHANYGFPRAPEKEAQFRAWLNRQFEAGILGPEGGKSGAPLWAAPYVRSAYRTGMLNAAEAAYGAGFTEVGGEEFLRTSFFQPETTGKLRTLYTRSYELLSGLTEETGDQLREVLARGIADGLGPMEIAKQMVERIGVLSRTRAATIARTEVIFAHAEGQLDAFTALRVETLGIQAEWSSAGDERVCDECAALEGRVFTVDEARGLIPRHPNCRCTWIPARVSEREGAAEKEGEERGSEDVLRWEDMGKDDMARREAYLRMASQYAPVEGTPEWDALVGYVGTDFININGFLREGGEDFPASRRTKVQKAIGLLDKTFERLPGLKRDVVAYRGTLLVEEWGPLKPGQVLTDKGFVSTSLDKGLSSQAFVGTGPAYALFEIRIPKGQKAIFATAVMKEAEFAREAELLLPRNSRFIVREVLPGEGPRGSTLVKVDVIPDEAPLPTGRTRVKAAPAEEVMRWEAMGETDLERTEAYQRVGSGYMPKDDRLREAVYRYTGTAHWQLNQLLRGGLEEAAISRRIGEEYGKLIKDLDKAIEKSGALPNPIVVYRGAEFPASQTFKVGDVLVDKGFVSTSFNQGVAEKFLSYGPGATMMEIRVPKGTHVTFASMSRTGMLPEVEVLLARNSRFIVREVTERGGYRLVRVDLIPPEAPSPPAAPSSKARRKAP